MAGFLFVQHAFKTVKAPIYALKGTNLCSLKWQSFVWVLIEEHFVHAYDYAGVHVFFCKVYLTVTWASGKQLRKSEVGRNRVGQVE